MDNSTSIGIERTLRVLATTPNMAAMDVLLGLVRSPSITSSIRAAKALAARRDDESHRQLLLALPSCQRTTRTALRRTDAVKRLRRVATAAIKGADEQLCQRASRYAVEVEDVRLLPALAEAAVKREGQHCTMLASAALQLARSLSEAIEEAEQGTDIIDPGGRKEDHAFNRSNALRSLGSAVDRFREHQRLELIDAFLMLVTPTDPMLKRIVKDESHPAHEPLIAALRTSPGYGAMEVLINAIEDLDSPDLLLQIAAQRLDRAYLKRLLSRVGEHPGLRTRQNVRRLTGFAWTEPKQREKLLTLEGLAQAAALRLFNSADTTRDDRIELIDLILRRGADAGRAAACEALRRVKSDKVAELLKLAMRDPCPDVIAHAVGQLRRNSYPSGLTELVVLLDHNSQKVVNAAQRALGEFSLDSYRQIHKSLTHGQRAVAGPLVAKADPDAIEEIASDLRAPMLSRRLPALELVSELAIVDRVVEDVYPLVEHEAVDLRAEAVRALGGSKKSKTIEVLAKALGDASPMVRDMAETSLRRLDSLEVAERLLEQLEAEMGDDSDDLPTDSEASGSEDASS